MGLKNNGKHSPVSTPAYQGPLETVACHLCSSTESETYLEVSGWTLVQCRPCGLIYLNPRPPIHKLPELYASEYFNDVVSTAGVVGLPEDPEEIESVVASQAMCLWQVNRYASPPGRLLDVGCGPGFFLAQAARAGWEVQGIDISQWATTYARDHLAVDVRTGTPEQVDQIWHDHFDVVTMFHVLEHLPEPIQALQSIRAVLRKEGILIVTVPNIGGYEARRQGPDWPGLSIPYHLYHFTPQTLRQVLQQAGFQVLTVKQQPSQMVADILKGLLGREPTPPAQARQGASRRTLRHPPRISWMNRIYAATLGRYFTGRNMTAFAKKGV